MDAYFAKIAQLPLYGIVENVLGYGLYSSDAIVDTLQRIPTQMAPAVHPALPVCIQLATNRIVETRFDLERCIRGAPDDSLKKRAEDAFSDFAGWRDNWTTRILDALQHREDQNYILPNFISDSLLEVLCYDARENRQEERLEDKCTLLESAVSRLDTLPSPIGTSGDIGKVDGYLASVLLRAFKALVESAEGTISSDLADSLWREFARLLPSKPKGMYWSVKTPRPLSNWMNGIFAAVLRDVSNPVESWLTAWGACSDLRRQLDRDDESLFENIEPNALLLIVGWLSVYGLYEHTGNWDEKLDRVWRLLASESVELYKMTRFAEIVGGDIGLKVGVQLSTVLPETRELLTCLQSSETEQHSIWEWVEKVLSP
jgi:hypothetical protein